MDKLNKKQVKIKEERIVSKYATIRFKRERTIMRHRVSNIEQALLNKIKKLEKNYKNIYSEGLTVGQELSKAELNKVRRKNIKILSLIKDLFTILDTKEESDSGTLFSPTFISTVRVMHSIKLKKILPSLRRLIRKVDPK